MPASTKTYDCLFEFTNDMAQPTILHLTRCSTGGVELWEGESVTLILESGSTYYYTVKQGAKEARISVRSWQSFRCTASAIVSGRPPSGQGVTVLSYL
ncbi:hypothetical protein K523DRAFT_346596 [Schizophyllum commune Tattone D]|nr:hypothetical protein K523DRAFT_346596 [Schizophyllum commune Tattone D]